MWHFFNLSGVILLSLTKSEVFGCNELFVVLFLFENNKFDFLILIRSRYWIALQFESPPPPRKYAFFRIKGRKNYR